jgi:FtsZ-interacting cell division protein ZipA
MTDGQFYMLIIAAETAVILIFHTVWSRYRARRQRQQWIRHVETRRRQQATRRGTGRPAA